MKYLLDTDHISILQRQSGREFAILSARISGEARSDLGFSIVSFHEQVLGAHAYINRARKAEDIVRGYAMMARILRQFAAAPSYSSTPVPRRSSMGWGLAGSVSTRWTCGSPSLPSRAV